MRLPLSIPLSLLCALTGCASLPEPVPGTRAWETRTADIALLDRLRQDLATAEGADAFVERFLRDVAADGGTPLVSRDGSERVAFIARGEPLIGWSVAGDFNDWKSGQLELTALSGTSLYVVELKLTRSRSYGYKLYDGGAAREDLRARNVVWDGVNRYMPGLFNALVYPELRPEDEGRLVAWRGFRSEVLDDARDVFVYLPPGYDPADAPAEGEVLPRFPTLYFHDGNETITRGKFIVEAEKLYAAKPDAASVLVFVALPEQEVRMDQYTFGPPTEINGTQVNPKGDAYLELVATELVPAIDEAFRTCPKPRDRGVAGISLGGLVAAHAGLKQPELFGYVGSQSGTMFWNDEEVKTIVSSSPPVPVRFYLDHGCPNDNCDSNRALASALTGKGYELRHVEAPGAKHDWIYWEERVSNVLDAFREGRAGCDRSQ